MNKNKLIELRCKAWGITEDEYYCNQCSDFSLEDMARAYRRGKNKGRAELEKENAELKAGVEKRDSDILTLKGLTERQRLKLDALEGQTPWKDIKDKSELIGKLTKAKEIIRNIIRVTWGEGWNYSLEWKVKAEQFLKEVEK